MLVRATSGNRSRATSGNRSRATSGNRSRATSGTLSRASFSLVSAIAIAAAPRPAIAADPAPPAPASSTKAHATLLPATGDADLAAMFGDLDDLLLDTSRDLGLLPDAPGADLPDPAAVTDAELLRLAETRGGPVLTATLRRDGATLKLRIALAAPGRRSLLARAERIAKDDLPVRAVVMLRDLVADANVVPKPPAAAPSPAPPPAGKPAAAGRSEGRAVLAANATLLGGLMGFSVERAGGSDDPRLLYPLLAVGAGVGLGASLLIAGEWDVGAGDAWFLSSGAVWSTAASHLLYEGRFGDASGRPGPEADRWAFGLVGGTVGIGLSTLSLAIGDMPAGGAVLAHSGGALGLAFGGLTEWFVQGDTRAFPFAGMGYGAALGWLAAAGVATTRVQLSPMRVLSIDLGAVLGGLAGAAIGSPLLVDGPTSTETRGWVGATAGGALLGAGVALFLTRGASPTRNAPVPVVKIAQGLTVAPDIPEIGTVAAPPLAPGPQAELLPPAAPAVGVRWRGRW